MVSVRDKDKMYTYMKAICGVMFSKPMDFVLYFSVFSVLMQPYKAERQIKESNRNNETKYCRTKTI